MKYYLNLIRKMELRALKAMCAQMATNSRLLSHNCGGREQEFLAGRASACEDIIRLIEKEIEEVK